MRALLAYDASPGADEAVALTLALPLPSSSNVRVAAVLELSAALVPSVPSSPTGLVTSPEIDAQLLDHLESEVGRVVNRLQSAGLEAEGIVLRGRPATVLVDEALRTSADLLIAGSRGHGLIARLVLGSVSAELVDQASCPVLVARRPTARRVLLATDGSPFANHAEMLVTRWPIFDDAEIRVISVAEVVRPWHAGLAPTMYHEVVAAYAEDLANAKTEQGAIAESAAGRLVAAGRSAEAKLRVGDAAAEIIDEAASWQADVVVLGTRGLTGLRRVLLGSVARNVLQGTSSSVLVVRDPDRPSG